jgi:uncharacterized protein (TIGR04255 family)
MKSPNFSAPPVEEVALGLSFQPSTELNILDVAELRECLKQIGFNEMQVHAPLTTRGSRVFQNINFQLKMLPGFPRFWFMSESKEYIIQIQQDKFAVNWRRSDTPTKKYVGFKVIEESFWKFSSIFENWYKQYAKDALKINGLDLTYYNNIPIEGGLNSSTLNNIYKDFQWSNKTVLSNSVQQMFFEVTLPVEKIDAQMFIMGHTAKDMETEKDLHRLEMAVIGACDIEGINKGLVNQWYSEAHDRIVHGFVELTMPDMHKIWGLEK